LTGSAITGLFTLAGSALVGALAYLQSRVSRQTERSKELAERKASLRFVTLQANPNWPQMPKAERLAEVRKVRHSVQEAIFAALLVAQEDTMGVLAGLNEEIFARGDQLVANPTRAPKAADVGPILLALHHDLKDLPD
jgi:hypothetical protein